jgi:hypothetical protein
MSVITDLADVPITYITMSLQELTDSAVFVIKVPCQANSHLRCPGDANGKVLMRLNGTSDTFVDIAVSPIDLNPYAGQTKNFDVKVHANDITGLVHAVLPVEVAFV